MGARFPGMIVEPVFSDVSATVPPLVPLVCHTWNPRLAVYAVKYSVPLTFVSDAALAPAVPLRFDTIAVPLDVPLLFHTSWPCTPSLPVKYSTLPTAVRFC